MKKFKSFDRFEKFPLVFRLILLINSFLEKFWIFFANIQTRFKNILIIFENVFMEFINFLKKIYFEMLIRPAKMRSYHLIQDDSNKKLIQLFWNNLKSNNREWCNWQILFINWFYFCTISLLLYLEDTNTLYSSSFVFKH